MSGIGWMVQKLNSLGASAEVIAVAVACVEEALAEGAAHAIEAEIYRVRNNERLKKQRQRQMSRDKSGHVPGQIGTCPGTNRDMSRDKSGHVPGQIGTCPGINGEISMDKQWHVQEQIMKCPGTNAEMSRDMSRDKCENVPGQTPFSPLLSPPQTPPLISPLNENRLLSKDQEGRSTTTLFLEWQSGISDEVRGSLEVELKKSGLGSIDCNKIIHTLADRIKKGGIKNEIGYAMRLITATKEGQTINGGQTEKKIETKVEVSERFKKEREKTMRKAFDADPRSADCFNRAMKKIAEARAKQKQI
jgi:hypothetical protein